MVRVEQVWVAHDCGRAINPLAVEGQMQGSVWMGMGQALCEETQYLEGLHAAREPARLPHADDRRVAADRDRRSSRRPIPTARSARRRRARARCPAFLPALTNAIADAIGVRLDGLPASPGPRARGDRRAAARGAACAAPRSAASAGGGLTWSGCPPFALQPADVARRGDRDARRDDPGARAIAGGTDLVPNLRDGLGAPPVLVDLSRRRRASTRSTSTRRPARDRRRRHARRASRAIAALARALPALSRGRGGDRRPRPPQRRDRRRQPVPRHALRLLQPERVVARGERVLPQARRRHLPRRAAGHALPRGVRRRPRAGADRAAAPRSRSPARAARGRLRSRTLYLDDGRAHLALAPGELVAAVLVPAQPARRAQRPTARRARAARSISRSPASPCASPSTTAASPRLDVALTGTNSRPFLLDGTDAFVGRAVDDTLLAELGKLVQKQVSPMRTTVTQSNWRRQVAAVDGAAPRARAGERSLVSAGPRADGSLDGRRGITSTSAASKPPEPMVAILSLIDGGAGRSRVHRPPRARPGVPVPGARRARLDRDAASTPNRAKCA